MLRPCSSICPSSFVLVWWRLLLWERLQHLLSSISSIPALLFSTITTRSVTRLVAPSWRTGLIFPNLDRKDRDGRWSKCAVPVPEPVLEYSSNFMPCQADDANSCDSTTPHHIIWRGLGTFRIGFWPHTGHTVSTHPFSIPNVPSFCGC